MFGNDGKSEKYKESVNISKWEELNAENIKDFGDDNIVLIHIMTV